MQSTAAGVDGKTVRWYTAVFVVLNGRNAYVSYFRSPAGSHDHHRNIRRNTRPAFLRLVYQIHTLLREDIALVFSTTTCSVSPGEKNIQLLLQQRPEAKAPLLGWQASAALSAPLAL
jgi:hypothetical protein